MTDRTRPRSRGFLLFAAVVIVAFSALAVALWPAGGGDLREIPQQSTILSLVRGTLAAFAAWMTSRALDHVALALPGPMSAAFAVILSNPLATGVYYGLRYFGLCVLYAGAL